jgi:hypothetical protein
MIDARIATERTAKNGSRYATVKVRVATRDAESTFVNLIAFSQSEIDALLALTDGDAVALGGAPAAVGAI